MATAYEIYVISNSHLFREGLNAVSAFCSSSGFQSATYIGALFGIVATAIAYVKQHDPLLFLKWFVIYFFVFNILLGVHQRVIIINTSDASIPGLIVDNVPIGISLPAHLITAIGYDFGSDLETDFHMPDSLSYNTTGMLFGSNLFRLSLASSLDNANTMNEMNAYVRSCVIGDILINHKYSMNDLLRSQDILSLMTSNPSPIRGIFIHGQFNTCQQAAIDLNQKINNYAGNKASSILAKFIPSHKIYAATAVNNYLEQSYQGLLGLSESASQILKQNISINAFRSGILNYAAETGSTAGMENYANTVAMQNTRMSWAVSSHMGIETLPLMQVVLLLLMLCLFPLIAVLTLIPNIGVKIFANYVYTLLWLESWPIMFTILNMAMDYYLSPGLSGTIHHVTLSNINRLAQEHSDIAGIAGYLILAIPFLSIGIVKGMASTFNQAAQYIGGMMHSIGQGAASSVAMGNYSLGNVSTGNATANSLSANKYDTNFSTMGGLSTQQLANGSTVTTTPSGEVISNVSGALSQLPISVNAAQSISASLSRSADRYRSDALTNRNSFDSALSNAATSALSYDSSSVRSQSVSDTSTTGVNSQVDHAISTMKTIAHEVAQRDGITDTEAFRKLTQTSIEGKIAFNGDRSLLGKAAKYGLGISAGISLNGSHQDQWSNDKSHNVSTDSSISQREADDFRSSMSVVENYSQSHSASTSSSNTNSTAYRVGNDFRNAVTAAKNMSADYATGERLSQQASYVSNNSDSIQSNFNQAFVNYVRKVDPSNANRILNNTSSASVAMQRQSLAENFLHQYSSNLEKNITEQSAEINPEKNYQDAVNIVHKTME